MNNTKKKNPDPVGIARRIKALRMQMGETQEDLAKAINVGQSTISKLELGVIARPNSDMMSQIATHYGKSLDYLINGAGKVRQEADGLAKVITNIERLSALLKDGDITREEFDLLRAQIIAAATLPIEGEN